MAANLALFVPAPTMPIAKMALCATSASLGKEVNVGKFIHKSKISRPRSQKRVIYIPVVRKLGQGVENVKFGIRRRQEG